MMVRLKFQKDTVPEEFSWNFIGSHKSSPGDIMKKRENRRHKGSTSSGPFPDLQIRKIMDYVSQNSMVCRIFLNFKSAGFSPT